MEIADHTINNQKVFENVNLEALVLVSIIRCGVQFQKLTELTHFKLLLLLPSSETEFMQVQGLSLAIFVTLGGYGESVFNPAIGPNTMKCDQAASF